MSYRTEIDRQPERTSGELTFIVRDQAGAAVPKSAMSSLKLTLYDKQTGTIINSRNAQNALDANNVTMHATSGLVTWSVQPADMAIVSTARRFEEHVALFVAVWATGERAEEIVIPVENLTKHPAA